MSKIRVAILLATILSLGFISIGFGFIVTSEIVPTSGAMYVKLTNRSNATMDASLFIYVRDFEDVSRIRFFNVTFAITRDANRTYLTSISDGSGVEVHIKSMEVDETVSFQVKNIEVSSDISINLNQLRIELEPRGSSTFFIDYNIIFSIIAWTRLSTFSVASVRYFNYRSGNMFEPLRYERSHEAAYMWVFFVLAFCLLSSVALSFAVAKWKPRIPFATLVIALFSVALYTLVGSGHEVLATLNYATICPISFLLHAYDNHLSGNLFYFLLASLLLESWLSVRKTWKTFLVWYIFPLFFTLISSGIGLSLSIESMTWALWARIVHERKHSTSFDTLMCILSGLPSFVFFGWLIPYLQGGLSPYNRLLAINHIIYGAISGVIVFVIYFAWWFGRKRSPKKGREVMVDGKGAHTGTLRLFSTAQDRCVR